MHPVHDNIDPKHILRVFEGIFPLVDNQLHCCGTWKWESMSNGMLFENRGVATYNLWPLSTTTWARLNNNSIQMLSYIHLGKDPTETELRIIMVRYGRME